MSSDAHVPGDPPPAQEPGHLPEARSKSRRGSSSVPFTRTAAAWWALIAGSLILIVLLIFIAQNLEPTTIHFLGWNWRVPVGIAVLVAAIAGALTTVMTGTARMVQLRRAAKKAGRGVQP